MSKHAPNSSEPSPVHSSRAEPNPHMDVMAFGEDGKRAPEHDTNHVTDEGHLRWAEAAHPTDYKSDSDSSGSNNSGK